jgi:hypothetical protein
MHAHPRSKKGKEPRIQVPRKVWKSEEGFGLIPHLNGAFWHFKVPFTVEFIEVTFTYEEGFDNISYSTNMLS